MFMHRMKRRMQQKIDVKSKWDPDLADKETVDIPTFFEANIHSKRETGCSCPRTTNHSRHQRNVLKNLCHKNSIAFLCYANNLGLAGMHCGIYMQETL